MSIIFNAEEIYQIGVEIEKNGEAFYREVAHAADDEDLKKLFTGLADWEQKHIKLFADLKESLTTEVAGETDFDADDQRNLYLKAAADSHVFRSTADVISLAADAKTPAEALALAMKFEKDSVVLYVSMKSMVPQKLGKDAIDRLIDEEVKHVTMLQNQLDALQGRD